MNRKAVAPVIATLLLVAIAVVGGSIIFVFSQGFFSSSQISGSPQVESIEITNTNYENDWLFVELQNQSAKKVTIAKISLAGEEIIYINDLDDKELPKYNGGLYQISDKEGTLLGLGKQPIIEAGQIINIEIINSNCCYREAQFRLDTSNGSVFITTIPEKEFEITYTDDTEITDTPMYFVPVNSTYSTSLEDWIHVEQSFTNLEYTDWIDPFYCELDGLGFSCTTKGKTPEKEYGWNLPHYKYIELLEAKGLPIPEFDKTFACGWNDVVCQQNNEIIKNQQRLIELLEAEQQLLSGYASNVKYTYQTQERLEDGFEFCKEQNGLFLNGTNWMECRYD